LRKESDVRALVVYESMFGNTHVVADHIGAGLAAAFEVTVTPVEGADPAAVAGADLLVVGGPTHAHGMTSAPSRRSAAEMAAKDEHLDLDPDAEGPGLRDWFHTLGRSDGSLAAAFDTRAGAPALLTGRASKGIARRLRHHGYRLVTDPESFLVDKENHLLGGEDQRARSWGAHLAELAAALAMPERSSGGGDTPPPTPGR
jgi:hypothetical protein